MAFLQKLVESFRPLLPSGIAIIGILVILFAAHYLLEKRIRSAEGARFQRQMIMIVLSLAGILVVLLLLPISDSARTQLLGLLGIIISAAIALSSTTFIGNVMAGLMLRAVRNFRPGDFVRVGQHFGRVSEQGLFHVEIQTVDSDLTTMPNLYLVTNPVKVIRSSGTLVTAEVSLGYNVPRQRIESLLIDAANEAQLQDPFVHVLELGDFAVRYRVAGLLTEVKQLISAGSKLRQMMLDGLHRAGIEIVSPQFMNTRSIPQGESYIPTAEEDVEKVAAPSGVTKPEELVFDKAEEAESIEKLRKKYDTLGQQIETMKDRLNQSKDPETHRELSAQIDQWEAQRKHLEELLRQKK